MKGKHLPFSEEQLKEITNIYPTPFHLYDEKGMVEYARKFIETFSWNKGFKEFYAIKACPNPYIMKRLFDLGFGIDASSMTELELGERIGMKGEEIMFSSNDTPAEEYRKAMALGATINLDDIKHISFLEEVSGLPDLLSFRYNPGALKDGNIIIGQPEESKYGFTRKQIFEGFKIIKDKGVKRFGLHTMVASNELDYNYFIETADILFNLALELKTELDIELEFVNLGGGIGIPYKSEHPPVNLDLMSQGIKALYDKIILGNGLQPMKLFFESGRAITGPFGYLVSKVLHIKETYKKYAGLDSSMANLMRPALYGAYHHISVIGKTKMPHDSLYDVTGSLCENNDKFAINRFLPELETGDIIVIHDTGAHGHSMGFNYNGKLRSAELLLRENGDVLMIRRAETVEDLFATVDFDSARKFQ